MHSHLHQLDERSYQSKESNILASLSFKTAKQFTLSKGPNEGSIGRSKDLIWASLLSSKCKN